jgi:hypothetical protein
MAVMSNLAQEKLPTFSVVYSIAEAARLCGLSQGRVRRWIQRSSNVVHTPGRMSKHGAMGLDFVDLIELRYVKAFVEAGVSWHVLRAVHARAAAKLHVDHPFATRKFFTDGYAILARIAEPALLEVIADRRVFSRMVHRYFAGEGGLDFDAGGMAVRWWPMGKKRLVVIDPERSFGQPIVSTEGVPTAVLYKTYLAENGNSRNGKKGKDDNPFDDREWTAEGGKPATIVRLGPFPPEPRYPLDKAAIARVANWYIVEERSVRAAIEYESDLPAAA